MGVKRHSVDEEKLSCQGVNNSSVVDNDDADRNSALSGYKKLLGLLLAFAFVFCFRTFVVERVIVSGDSMNPSFADGDVMWARKYGINELERYQVVVAKAQGQLVIKRVIGLPNETVRIVNGEVCINGVKLCDDYGYQTAVYGCASDEYILGVNEYFLMGDNRDYSVDSRVWGSVNISDINGIVFLRFFPFWKLGFVD